MAREAHNKTHFSEIVEFFKETKYILLDDDYIFKRKINYKDSEGYLYQSYWYDINVGKPPSKFGNNNKWTSHNINLFFLKDGGNFELLTKDMMSVTKNAEFKCRRCGNIFISNFHTVRSMNYCENCDEHPKLNIDKIKNRVASISENIIILTEKYVPNEKLKCKCKIDEHIWYAHVNKLLIGKGCPECKRVLHIGENNNKWKGGITPLHNKLRGEISLWKRKSFVKTQYKCIITGKKSKVVIHHMYPFNKIIDESLILSGVLSFDITNYNYEDYLKIATTCIELHEKYGLGVPLHEDIHNEFHSI